MPSEGAKKNHTRNQSFPIEHNIGTTTAKCIRWDRFFVQISALMAT